MRVNRNIGIGLGFIALALILLIVLFRRTAGTPDNTANNVAPVEQVGDDGTHAAGNGRVAVALDYIPERTILTPDLFVMKSPEDLPVGMPTDGLVTDPEEQATGYITRFPIQKNAALRTDDLIGPIGKVSIADVIRPGLRGMVVPVTTNPTLHDLVRIGNYVDIVAAFDGQESRTIVQNVRVLAVDVYGADYPPLKVAMRGPNKANAPAGSERPAQAPAAGAAPQSQATATPGPPPAPTPTPPPSAAPAPALTLEVSPAQATAISLAMAAGAPLDFLLRPREIAVPTTLADARLAPRAASSNRAQLAPYAEAVKRRGAGGSTTQKSTTVRTVSDTRGTTGTSGGRDNGRIYNPPPMINPPVMPVAPVNPGNMPPAQPKTYDIPIYADGHLVRTDTVRKPD